jgi:hypothetical protein
MASFLTDLKRKLGVQQPRQAWDEQVPNNLQSVAQPNPTPQIQQTYSQNINPTVAQVQPAPVDQTVATRPRSVMNNVRNAVSQPQQQVAPQQVRQAPTQTLDTGATRDRRTQPRDYIADDEAALRQLQNQKDPFWKRVVIAGINAGQAGFGYQPTQIQTGRMRDLAKLQGQLGQEIKTGEARTRIEQGSMVPVVLDSGETVMVPARSAGSVRSNQQRIGMQRDQENNRKEVNKARVAHWDSMDKDRRHRLLADLYKSGGLNDPDQLQYAADELGIPGSLREKFIAGQMRDAIDENGNLGQVNRQTNTFTPTTQTDASGRPRTVGSYQKTVEANKTNRFNTTQNNKKQGGGLSSGQQNTRERMANDLVAKYNQAVSDEQDTLNNVSPSDIKPQDKAHLRSVRENLWNQIMSTYPGMFESELENGGGKLRPKGSGSDLDKPNYGVPTGRGSKRGATKASTSPATHNFSISGFIQRNKGATEADARAEAEKNYRGYDVVP